MGKRIIIALAAALAVIMPSSATLGVALIEPATALGVPSRSTALNTTAKLASIIGPAESTKVRGNTVDMHGHFTDAAAKVPKGYAFPSGTHMHLKLTDGGQIEELILTGETPAQRQAASEQNAVAHDNDQGLEAFAATWGGSKKCQMLEGKHCYAESEWPKGTKDGAATGQLAFQNTTNANVHEWEQFAFADSETWAITHEGPTHWIETGQEAGSGWDCCSLHPFYATMRAGGYLEYRSPQVLPANTDNSFGMYHTAGTTGTWCVYWYFNSGSPVKCLSSLNKVAVTLQIGTEVYAATKPAWNTGDLTNLREHDNTTDKAWTTTYWYAWPEMCIAHNPRSSAPGNVLTWTC